MDYTSGPSQPPLVASRPTESPLSSIPMPTPSNGRSHSRSKPLIRTSPASSSPPPPHLLLPPPHLHQSPASQAPTSAPQLLPLPSPASPVSQEDATQLTLDLAQAPTSAPPQPSHQLQFQLATLPPTEPPTEPTLPLELTAPRLAPVLSKPLALPLPTLLLAPSPCWVVSLLLSSCKSFLLLPLRFEIHA